MHVIIKNNLLNKLILKFALKILHLEIKNFPSFRSLFCFKVGMQAEYWFYKKKTELKVKVNVT